MKIPKYWSSTVIELPGRGPKPVPVTIWRGSDSSPAEAQMLARQAAEALLMRFRSGQALGRYGYGERQLREEVLETLPGEAAVITRNAYGARVINTARVMFADIDFPEPRTGLGESLRRLFGGRRPEDPQAAALQRLERWSQAHPGLGLRVYRTAGGLRCLFTNQLFDPRAAETIELLNSLDSDPLYVKLCRDQECFRARLSPKPWRIGIRSTPPRYPQQNERSRERISRWIARYEQAGTGYTVCRLVQRLGAAEIHPEAQAVLQLHDRLACSGPGGKLA